MLKTDIFKNYEKRVLELLVENKLPTVKLSDIFHNVEFIGYEYTGSGYYLTVRHPNLPKNRMVFSHPALIGEAEKIECGFVIFIENNEMIFECHSWGEVEIPTNYREKNIEIREFNEINPK
jgi:hypothetical protein